MAQCVSVGTLALTLNGRWDTVGGSEQRNIII